MNEYRCSKNGDCDYCLEKCSCKNGFGASTDIVTVGVGLDGECLSWIILFFSCVFKPLCNFESL